MENLIKAVVESWKVFSINCFKLYVYVKEKIISIIELLKKSFSKKKKLN